MFDPPIKHRPVDTADAQASSSASVDAAGKGQTAGTELKKNSVAPGDRLVDTFARSITYLRISLTDHCNLRCMYCTPKKPQDKLPNSELLTYEEILRIVSLAVEMGVGKVRLTGGEPLVRRGIISFIKGLTAIAGLDDIRLTTNGVLLADFAEELYDAGIRKLNISLDTLRPERYREITGADHFARVWSAINRVKEMGFSPIKINMVALQGVNDDELLDFGRLSINEPLQIRFIEFMPVGKESGWEREKYIAADEIKARLMALGPLEPVRSGKMDGPARIFRFAGAKGTLGFISPISNHFCDKCNRLRLTSEGRLRSCLLQDRETDIKAIIRGGEGDAAIKKALLETVLDKPKGHRLPEKGAGSCHGRMSRIGG